MPGNSYNSYENMYKSIMIGGSWGIESDTIPVSRLLIVKNALEAVVFAGANLLAMTGWCVICDSGEKDGGEKLFYKNMSNMGVYEYYYGFGENNSHLQRLASEHSWCVVATTNAEIVSMVSSIFVNNSVQLIESGDVKLQPKINRYKTILVQSIEAQFKEEENPNDLEYLKTMIPVKQLGGELTITSSQISDLHKLLAPEEFVEFTQRSEFTIRNVLAKMIENKDKLRHILYIPSDTTTNGNYELLKKAIPYICNLDFVFVDNRPNPTVAEQYFYKIDLDQPILLRNNARTRKLIAFLNDMNELETFFREGYQFLTSLRMSSLNRMSVHDVHIAENRSQSGGILDFNDDTENMDDYLDDTIVQSTDIFDLTCQIKPQLGGLQKRKTLKQRKMSVAKTRRTTAS